MKTKRKILPNKRIVQSVFEINMTTTLRRQFTKYSSLKILSAVTALSFCLQLFLLPHQSFAQNSELYESSEYGANSQYDADPDFRDDDTQLHFAQQSPAVPPTLAPPQPPPIIYDNTPSPSLMSSSDSGGASLTYTELSGGSITSDRILRASESPYAAREPIIIEKGAKLIIEPGVRIEFAPTVGITVRGIIHAVVSIEYVYVITRHTIAYNTMAYHSIQTNSTYNLCHNSIRRLFYRKFHYKSIK